MAASLEQSIHDFLADVADDPDKAKLVCSAEGRKELIEKSKLNDRQKKILYSHDLDKIRCAIEYESEALMQPCWIWVVT
jgi:hypothetical protein